MLIEVKPFMLPCTVDEQACKVLEEAAEVYAAWQAYERSCIPINGVIWPSAELRQELADEIADVIQAACNLAARYGCFELVETWSHKELANMGALGSKCDDKTMAVAVLQKANLVYAYWWRSADMVDESLTETEKKRLANRVDGLIMYAVAFAARFGIDVAAAMERCEQRNRERGRYDD